MPSFRLRSSLVSTSCLLQCRFYHHLLCRSLAPCCAGLSPFLPPAVQDLPSSLCCADILWCGAGLCHLLCRSLSPAPPAVVIARCVSLHPFFNRNPPSSSAPKPLLLKRYLHFSYFSPLFPLPPPPVPLFPLLPPRGTFSPSSSSTFLFSLFFLHISFPALLCLEVILRSQIRDEHHFTVSPPVLLPSPLLPFLSLLRTFDSLRFHSFPTRYHILVLQPLFLRRISPLLIPLWPGNLSFGKTPLSPLYTNGMISLIEDIHEEFHSKNLPKGISSSPRKTAEETEPKRRGPQHS